jgi:hypothetical protein
MANLCSKKSGSSSLGMDGSLPLQIDSLYGAVSPSLQPPQSSYQQLHEEAAVDLHPTRWHKEREPM